jgi:hypothetical protein
MIMRRRVDLKLMNKKVEKYLKGSGHAGMCEDEK